MNVMSNNKYDYNKICTVKELCQMLGFRYDKYHSKRSLEEIERHFEIEKISDRKYRLVKELSEDEKIERWKVTEYKKLFKDVVYTVLSCSEDNSILKSDDDYMLIFHMVNKNFKMFTQNYINQKRDKFLFEHNKDVYFEADALYFADEVKKMLKGVLRTTFDKMKEENLIYIKEHIVFGIYKTFVDDKGKTVPYSEPRFATNEEIELLMETETKVLQENELSDRYESIKEISDYKLKCYLRNQIAFRLGIVYYRTDKELILNRYGLNYKVERDENLLELKRHLNKGTINKVLNSTQGKLKEIEKYRRDELAQLLIEVNDSGNLL